LCHIESDFHEIVVNTSSPELFFESSEEIPKPHMFCHRNISPSSQKEILTSVLPIQMQKEKE
jgi:hypothetical protein